MNSKRMKMEKIEKLVFSKSICKTKKAFKIFRENNKKHFIEKKNYVFKCHSADIVNLQKRNKNR